MPRETHNRSLYVTALARIILLSVVFFNTAHGKTEATLQSVLQEVRDSVDLFISIKDSDTLDAAEKETKKNTAAKITLGNIIKLGALEVAQLQNELDDLTIENLVASDFTFDAAEANDMLKSTLAYYDAYYASALTRLNSAQNYNEIQQIARDLKSWREQSFKPGAQRISGLSMVLHNKEIIKIANGRFNKILTDLKKLKNAKLITFETLQDLLNGASASIKAAEALDVEATALVIKTLKTSPLTTNNQTQGNQSDHQRLGSILDQSFTKIKDAYKKFIETNGIVRKMMGIQ